LDALRKSEIWLRKLADDNIDQDPKFERFMDLIKSHDELVRAKKWMSAHDTVEDAFAQFVEITNQIMTRAKERLDTRDKKEKPVVELLDNYKNALKQISRAAQSIADNADGMLDNLEHTSKH
jgi:ABC-type transporter Mla subunit MlaD